MSPSGHVDFMAAYLCHKVKCGILPKLSSLTCWYVEQEYTEAIFRHSKYLIPKEIFLVIICKCTRIVSNKIIVQKCNAISDNAPFGLTLRWFSKIKVWTASQAFRTRSGWRNLEFRTIESLAGMSQAEMLNNYWSLFIASPPPPPLFQQQVT